jgi:5-methyltetrahydrofolate--homocysteine methyltransferase
MGVFLQSYNLPEADFRGDRFRGHHRDLKGNFDILCLTRPDLIEGIHHAYLEAGADIIETNTFNATPVSQAEFDLPAELCYDINRAAAVVARRAARCSHAERPGPAAFRGWLYWSAQQNAVAVARCERPRIQGTRFR